MENPPHDELFYDGNKGFMELFDALKKTGLPQGEAAKAAAQVYERCGYQGYILPARG